MASSVLRKVAFITGGASGIGAALAAELAHQGADVWIADRQIGEAQELTRQLNEAGGQAHAIELDVRSYPDFERAVGEAVQHGGRIDYLFNGQINRRNAAAELCRSSKFSVTLTAPICVKPVLSGTLIAVLVVRK